MYYTHYPHFTIADQPFGTEQTAPNPGSRILDTVTNQFGYRNDYDLPGFVTLYGLYSLSLVDYPQQNLVDSTTITWAASATATSIWPWAATSA